MIANTMGNFVYSTLDRLFSSNATGSMYLFAGLVFMIVIARLVDLLWQILLVFIKLTLALFRPIDYKHDMTTKSYCKSLAEVDNNLKIQNNVIANGEQIKPQVIINASLDSDTPHLPDDGQRETSSTHTNGNINANRIINSDVQSGSTEHLYPNGWLPLIESSKVKPGTLKKAIILGRDVIVTRSTEGHVSVLDAYCPHMGVHIGVGGKMCRIDDQSCVQCPFHGWTFRTSDGQCVKIPYVKGDSKCGIPKQAKLGVWTSCEVNNFIYIWHHIDGQPPSWQLEPLRELPSMILAGRSYHLTNLEIRDILENGADFNHFEGIHNDLFVFGGEFLKVQAYNHLQQYFRHHWAPEWEPVLDENGKMTHKAEMKLSSWISIFKRRVFDIKIKATQVGPAFVSLRYDSDWYGRGILNMNGIPLGGRRTLYVQHIYTERSLFNWSMAKWVLYGEIKQLERDLFIWNHKKNIKNPIFVHEDKVLKKFRLWYSQFYKRKRKVAITDKLDHNDNVGGSTYGGIKCSDNLDF